MGEFNARTIVSCKWNMRCCSSNLHVASLAVDGKVVVGMGRKNEMISNQALADRVQVFVQMVA